MTQWMNGSRLQYSKDPQQPQQLPQFNNPEVIAKMRDFHNDIAALQSVKCLICYEQFPSISVNEIGNCKGYFVTGLNDSYTAAYIDI